MVGTADGYTISAKLGELSTKDQVVALAFIFSDNGRMCFDRTNFIRRVGGVARTHQAIPDLGRLVSVDGQPGVTRLEAALNQLEVQGYLTNGAYLRMSETGRAYVASSLTRAVEVLRPLRDALDSTPG